MISRTLVSQTALLVAGFYTTLPPGINILRYASPVTYTYTGILKTSLRQTDTYQCMQGGLSDIGVNQCYIEQSVGIDIIMRRGINDATFHNPSTESTWKEVLILFGLYISLNLAILGILLFRITNRPHNENEEDAADEKHKVNRSVHGGSIHPLPNLDCKDAEKGDTIYSSSESIPSSSSSSSSKS